MVQTGAHFIAGQALGLPAREAALDGLRHGDRLRHGEAHRRVDRHAAVGGLLHRLDAGGGGGQLDLHIPAERVEHDGLLDHLVPAAVVFRVHLDREAALPALEFFKDGQQLFAALPAHLVEEQPGDLVLGGRGVLRDQSADAGLPVGELLLDHRAHDDRVARRAHDAALEAVVQLLLPAGVHPDVGVGKADRRLVQHAFIVAHVVSSCQWMCVVIPSRCCPTRRGRRRGRRR